MGSYIDFKMRIRALYYRALLIFQMRKAFKVMNTLETIHVIKNNNLSFIRLGDGEFRMIAHHGSDIGFQKSDPKLITGLQRVVSNYSDKLLLCIPRTFSFSFENMNIRAQSFWARYIYKTINVLPKIIDKNRSYGDALITRLYIDASDRTKTAQYFSEIKKIWGGADIVIVEGALTRFGVGNDLLDNAHSVKRIIVPPKNAFEYYDQILSECRKHSKSSLFMLAIGPTAKVLALDLFNDGYRVFDVGHLDLEYEWFLAKAEWKQPVPGKYFNEATNSEDIFKDEADDLKSNEKYLSQIICRIG